MTEITFEYLFRNELKKMHCYYKDCKEKAEKVLIDAKVETLTIYYSFWCPKHYREVLAEKKLYQATIHKGGI